VILFLINIDVKYVLCLKAEPLFKKLESKEIEALKQRFKVKQETVEANGANSADPFEGQVLTVDELNELVTKQGNKVRDLKAQKETKPVIDKEVKILLDLKKRLGLVSGDSQHNNVSNSKKKHK
jgi:methionyl-tRNA synthetase